MSSYSDEVKLKILNALIDKYEGSKSFTGDNLVSQTFAVKPDFIMPSYYSDFADIDEIAELNFAISQIEEEGLIRIEQKKGIIKRIVAVESRISDYYVIIGRYPKNEIKDFRIRHLNSAKGKHQLIDRLVDAEIMKLSNGYKAVIGDDEFDDIISLLNYILHNSSEILERELSISVLGDSKTFEKKYRHKICRILSEYSDDSTCNTVSEDKDSRLWEIETLADYFVVPNPSYIYFKGEGTIDFGSGKIMKLYTDIPVAISSQSLRYCVNFKIESDVLMTVENLTSFNRMHSDGRFLVYLEGYHSKSKQNLLMQIVADNTDKVLQFYHFGDIDPDGFMILRNLCNKTGIDFKPYRMEIAELETYSNALKELTVADRKKAESLISQGLYNDVLTYMLEHNCKLEQEIISLKA